jgi:hypothetical protein
MVMRRRAAEVPCLEEDFLKFYGTIPPADVFNSLLKRLFRCVIPLTFQDSGRPPAGLLEIATADLSLMSQQ